MINLISCTSKDIKKKLLGLSKQNSKAAFFDRDGVINVDYNYVSKIDELEFVKGVFAAFKYIQSKGYDIFIITNQSGVARGFYEEIDIQILHAYMNDQFRERGIEVSGYLYCPHYVNAIVAKYSKDCNWRKPNPGMIEAIFSLNHYDKKKCFLIGDRKTDLLAAKNAGIRGEQFCGGSLESFVKENF